MIIADAPSLLRLPIIHIIQKNTSYYNPWSRLFVAYMTLINMGIVYVLRFREIDVDCMLKLRTQKK